MRFVRLTYIVRGEHKLTFCELIIIRIYSHIILVSTCSLLWYIHRHVKTTDFQLYVNLLSRLLVHLVDRNKLVVLLG